jgi:sugar/nucleoside kinase (ribokinase family)
MTNMNQKANALLIVGSMAFDDLELPTITAKNVVGGSATYSAYAASVFSPVRIVAVVGEDFPSGDLEALSKRNVDLAGLERASGKTFRWAGRYDPNLVGRVTLDTQLNVFADFSPKLPKSYVDSPYVLLGNIHPALQIQVLDQIKSPKLVMADTMNFWIEGQPEALAAMLKRIDLLVINEEEARQLSGQHNITKAAKDILRRGPKSLIVKRGEYGALLFDGESTFFAPAYPLEDVVDPTGAGDTFAGAFAGYLAKTGDLSGPGLRRAIMVGSAAASFCVEAVGTAKVGRLGVTDISTRLDLFRNLMHVSHDALSL